MLAVLKRIAAPLGPGFARDTVVGKHAVIWILST